jgi:hypothetical protein
LTPEHVTVDVQQPRWVDALRDVLVVGNDEQASHHEHTASAENAEIIDAEIVEDDPIFE